MTTPEGRVKAKLRRLFKGYANLFAYWSVPTGFGTTTLDVLGCYRGRFFNVETKAYKKKPTLRQAEAIKNIELAMGRSFVISGEDSPVFDELRQWLDTLTEEIPDDPHLTPDPVRRSKI